MCEQIENNKWIRWEAESWEDLSELLKEVAEVQQDAIERFIAEAENQQRRLERKSDQIDELKSRVADLERYGGHYEH